VNTSRTPMAASGPQSLEAATLRIFSTAGDPVAVGFLVTRELALTCAHVVSNALAAPQDAQWPEGAVLTVDMPLLAKAGQDGAGLTATVEKWIPAQPSGAGDVAVLRLSAPVEAAAPVRLIAAPDVWGHKARAFGFPNGHPAGVWHAGLLLAGHANWVQMNQDPTAGGYPVSYGFSGAPVWDNTLGAVVGMLTAAEIGTPPVSYLIPTERLVAAWEDLAALVLAPSPFRPLKAFEETEAGIFYGRQTESERIADAVAGAPRTTLVGPSGSGKSSLAKAGVAPRRRAAGDIPVVIRPSQHSSPLHALAAELVPLLEPGLSEIDQIAKAAALADILSRQGLHDMVPRLLKRHQGSRRLLIVIDQFEELLDLPPDHIDALAGVLAGDRPAAAVSVLSTLRADFLEPVLGHPLLRGLAGDNVEILAPMAREQLEQVIHRPIDATAGVQFEPGLAKRILDDAGAEPGVLPLLAFLLDQLWGAQTGGMLTHRAFEELGGVSGALSAYTKVAWAQLPKQDGPAARRLLSRLVQLPIGTLTATRRIAPREEVPEDEWRIAQGLAATGLLVLNSELSAHGEHGPIATAESVELAHEALITAWDVLAEQITHDRDFLTWRDTLRHDQERWAAGEHAADLLPTKTALSAAQKWLPSRAAEMGEAEHEYLRRGRAHHNSRKRRRRAWIAAVCALALVATAAAVASVRAQRDAAQKAAVVRSASLAADAAAISSIEPGLAAQLAVAAYRTSPTQDAVTQLYTALSTPFLDRIIGATHKTVLRVAAQQHGPLAAAIDEDGSLRIWNLADPAAPVLDATVHTQAAAIALAPHAGLLAAACDPKAGLCLWDVADPHKPKIAAQLPLPADMHGRGFSVTSMAVSPDDALLAAAAEQGFTLLWSIADPAHPRFLANLRNPTRDPSAGLPAVAFAPRGHLLAETIQGGATQLWNLTAPATPAKAAVIAGGYQAVGFNPDGSLLAAVGDANIGLWKVQDPAHPAPITVTDANMFTDMGALAFSPDGTRLVYNGTDTTDSKGQMCLLGLSPADLNTTGGPTSTCTPDDIGTTAMAYTINGALLTGGPDGTVRLRSSPLPQINGVYPYGDTNWSLSPSGRQVAVPIDQGNGSSTSVGIWDIAASGNPTLKTTVPISADMVRYLGPATMMTVDSNSKAVQLWDLRDPQHPAKAASLSRVLSDAQAGYAVSTDAAGDMVSIAGQDGLLHLWHVTSPNDAVQVASIPASDPTLARTGVLPDGRTAFLITSAGINWWDISNPAHPVHRSTSPLKDVGAAPERGNVELTGYTRNIFTATTPPGPICGCATLGLWDVSAGHAQSARTLSDSAGEAVGLSGNGHLVAASGAGKDTLTLWDTSNPQQPRTLASLRSVEGLFQIAFDPTGHYLAAAGSGGIELWDIRNPAAPVLEANIAPPGYSGLDAITFTPTGATLVVPDTSVYLYDTEPAKLADRLCSYTGGTITTTQWQQYAPGIPYQNPCP
jgi:WD40 repeat protein